MAAANRSPLGFPVIIAFHLCVILWGVILQSTYDAAADLARWDRKALETPLGRPGVCREP